MNINGRATPGGGTTTISSSSADLKLKKKTSPKATD